MPYKDKDKQRKFQREWRASRRKDFFEGKQCILCGNSDNLELDHIDPKEKTTHRIWSFTKEKRESEISKCQILCKACHLEKTLRQRREKVRLD